MSYTLGMSDWYIVTNIFRNVTAMLETEVKDFYFVDIFNNPIQLIWVLPFWHKVKFWYLHQSLSCCLSLSCVWSTILWSNCRPKMGRKLSDMCSCTSLCIHHTQLCHDEGTLGSKWPLTTGYEASLATPTQQRQLHQIPFSYPGSYKVSIRRVGFLTLHLFFISKTVQLG